MEPRAITRSKIDITCGSIAPRESPLALRASLSPLAKIHSRTTLESRVRCTERTGTYIPLQRQRDLVNEGVRGWREGGTTYVSVRKANRALAGTIADESHAVDPGPDAREDGSRRIHPSPAAFIP